MATQSPNNNITIKVNNIAVVTSVNADGGSTWKQIESTSTTLTVNDKLYIQYANIGGTYKNNVVDVTDGSGNELTIVHDENKKYTVVTIPNGTTIVNIDYASLQNNNTNFIIVFSVSDLSNSYLKRHDKIHIEVQEEPYGNVYNCTVDATTGGTIIINQIEYQKSYTVKSVYIDNKDLEVSFIDVLNWQNNKTDRFIGTQNYTKHATIYVDYASDYGPATISPSITNISKVFNPKISFYKNTNDWDKTTKLFKHFELLPLHNISTVIPNNSYTMLNGPSYNSTFTDINYINWPVTFQYDTPFRIYNDGLALNSEYVSGNTYEVTFNLTRNKNLPYYSSDQKYRIDTNPYYRYFNFRNTNNYDATIRFTYTVNNKSTHNGEKIAGTDFIPCYTYDMFEQNHSVKFTNIWACASKQYDQSPEIDSSYFCPYIEINNVKYMCYDGFKALNLSGVTPPLVNATLLKYDIVKPKIVVPSVPNNITLSVAYNYITSTASPNPITVDYIKYQFKSAQKSDIKINENTYLDYWSNWGYNVRNDDYTLKLKLELTNEDKTKFAYDFDLETNNSNGKLSYTINDNIKTFTIKPNNENKYFEASEPEIDIFPKTSIKYVNNLIDSEGLNIHINLSYSVNKVQKLSNIISSGTTTETERFTYSDKASHKLTISSITTINPIAYIKVEWNGGSRTINNVYPGQTLLENNELKQPITWNSPSITYTFTVATTTPVQPHKYAYGIEIDGNGLTTNNVFVTFALTDDNDYIIKSYSSGTLNDTKKILTVDCTSIHNTQTIYIDKVDSSAIYTQPPYFQLYNNTTSYYVNPTLLPEYYVSSSDSTCEYKGTIKLNDYIKYNIAQEYASKINFKPISVKYKATLNILNNDNTIVKSIETGEVSTTKNTTVSIPDNYVSDAYNVAISNITGISSTGSEFPIERYNLNLVNISGQSISYNIYKPIDIDNRYSNIKITEYAMLENDLWNTHYNDILIPKTSCFMYQSSYIAPVKFESKNIISDVKLIYHDGTTKTVNINNANSMNNTFYAYVDDIYHPLKSIYIIL